MRENENPKTLFGIAFLAQAFADQVHDREKKMALDYIKQLFLGFEVVVETGQGHPAGSSGYRPHHRQRTHPHRLPLRPFRSRAAPAQSPPRPRRGPDRRPLPPVRSPASIRPRRRTRRAESAVRVVPMSNPPSRRRTPSLLFSKAAELFDLDIGKAGVAATRPGPPSLHRSNPT